LIDLKYGFSNSSFNISYHELSICGATVTEDIIYQLPEAEYKKHLVTNDMKQHFAKHLFGKTKKLSTFVFIYANRKSNSGIHIKTSITGISSEKLL
jgi:hypothetical protein